MVFGIAFYNSIILNLNFPIVFYKKLLDEEINLQDLQQIEPELYISLTNIQKEKNIEKLGLTF